IISFNPQKPFDDRVIDRAVAVYKSSPKTYASDFGVTETGKTLLVEVNNGYSLGSYGLFYLDYAKFLSAKWSEMTGAEDYCNF
ncbi:MAG: ATP-grasp domain-containing protein, partial [Xenococcaceae cyanobacterium]